MSGKVYSRNGLVTKRQRQGWLFLIVGIAIIVLSKFYPMIHAFYLSLQSGVGLSFQWAGFGNYVRLTKDNMFRTSVVNTVIFLIQIPLMLMMALVLASLLNRPNLKFRAFYRTAIYLPCVTATISYSTVFRAMFTRNGFINSALMNLGIIGEQIPWLENVWLARLVILLAMTWRWTGYNTIFYLSGLQSIDESLYEAATIDGADKRQQLFKITIPLLRPIILLTVINSINGTLQLFTETDLITAQGPGGATMTMSNYIYKLSFSYMPQYGYASAIAYVVFMMVAVLSLLQMKVSDER